MKERSVTHASFTLERIYDAKPARVFNAFADPVAKARWFSWPEEMQSGPAEFDFREGGRERAAGGPPGSPVHTFNCIYWDIVKNERIVYTYDMHLDDERISVSLATIEFKPEGSGTRLILTEQGAFLDGYDDPAARERGTRELLDALGEALRESVSA